MRKWTGHAAYEENGSAAERYSFEKPSDAERVKLRARAFTRWVATKTRRAEEQEPPSAPPR